MDIISLCKAVISVFSTLAKYTTTTVDDQIVAFLTAALDNPAVLDLLHAILHDQDVVNSKDEARNLAMMGAVGRFDGSRLQAIKEFLAAAGITWEQVMTYLPLVIRIFLSLSGKR